MNGRIWPRILLLAGPVLLACCSENDPTAGSPGRVFLAIILAVMTTWILYNDGKPWWLTAPCMLVGVALLGAIMQPVNLHFHPLPHWHWISPVIICIIWAISRFKTETTIDDKALKIWLVIALVISLAIRGLVGSKAGVSPFWWTLVLMWVILGTQIIIGALETRPFARKLVLGTGWYCIALLA